MEKSKNLLEDLPRFSSKGEEIYEALTGLQMDDRRVKIFAKRAARAVTAHEAGNFEKSGPLERFLLCGTTFSSISLFVQTLAKTWLGKPWDGSYPFIYVDCGAFHAVYPGMLASLIGPVSPDALGFQTSPLLGQINLPHLKARRGEDLKLLQEWNEGFQKRWSSKIDKLGIRVPEFFREFRVLASGAWQDIYDEEFKKHESFGSVIFFDRINYASQPLRELMLQILHNGSLTLATGTRVDFSDSIIIFSIYIDERLLRKVPIGIRDETEDFLKVSDDLQQTYHRVRKNLLTENGKENGSATFVQGVAENLIIISERTRENQTERIKTELERIKGQFKDRGIELIFTPRFIEGFLGDTKELIKDGNTTTEVYTEERIVSGLKRHILDALHRLVLFSELRAGSSLCFDWTKEGKFCIDVSMTQEGDGDPISPEIERIQASDEIMKDESSWPEWLRGIDDKAKKLLSKYK